MRNRIFKYFFISLLVLIGGLLYFTMLYTNRIVVKQAVAAETTDTKKNQDSRQAKEQNTGSNGLKDIYKESASKASEKNYEKVQEKSKVKEKDQIKEAADVQQKEENIDQNRLTGNHRDSLQQEISEEVKATANMQGEPMININSAGKAELMTLKGIGEKKAEMIIKYRQTNGHFQRIEEIMKIKGIKRKAFEKIKNRICVSD